ncbi:MAG: lysylphosphatidylglycerol synthase transmembrane domain-containing protein [Dehalococcoidia bacterium]|nr:lysylphosphatidylglycerol synthase transmembrane domain-containing protein [Dehalococcoidia bacterium]
MVSVFSRYVKKLRGFWPGLILATAFIFFFFRGAQLSEMVSVLARVNYYLVIPAVAAYFVGLWLRAVRWSFSLAPIGRVSPQRLFSPVVIGFALNNILPGRLGFVARAYLVGERERISKVACGTSILAASVFDGVALLSAVAVVSLFVPLPGWARGIVTGVSILYFGLFGMFWLLVSFPDAARRAASPAYTRLPIRWQSKTADWVGLGLTGLRILRSPDRIAVVLLLSFLVLLAESAMFYMVAVAFDLGLSFHMVVLVVAIANMVQIIPALPGNIGPFEYFGKQTLLVFKVTESVATAYIAVAHLVHLFPTTVLGLLLLWRYRRRIHEVTAWREE